MLSTKVGYGVAEREDWTYECVMAGVDLDRVALRFSAYAPGVDCVIVGGADARYLQKNVAAVTAGPLLPEQLAAIRGAFSRAATNWRGLI